MTLYAPRLPADAGARSEFYALRIYTLRVLLFPAKRDGPKGGPRAKGSKGQRGQGVPLGPMGAFTIPSNLRAGLVSRRLEVGDNGRFGSQFLGQAAQ